MLRWTELVHIRLHHGTRMTWIALSKIGEPRPRPDVGFGRYCRKSHRIRAVELEIETNESKEMVFESKIAGMRLILNQCC